MICKGCKIYMSIVEIDNQRYYWTEQLSRTNSELHKKVIYLGSYISILEKKLANLNEIILLKDVAYSSQVLEIAEKNSEKLKLKDKSGNEYNINNWMKKLKNLCNQLDNALEDYQSEKNRFEKITQNQEKEFGENMIFLQEMVQTYRENLFKEIKKYNNLKMWIHDKLQVIKKETENYIKTCLDSKEKELNERLKTRYKSSLQHSNEQIEKQDDLIKKMQIHRRELYSLLKEERLKQKEVHEKYQKDIAELKSQIGRLKQKNENMEAVILLH